MSFQCEIGLISAVVQAGQLSKGLFVVVKLRERDRMRDLLKEQGLPFDLEQGWCVEPAQMQCGALVEMALDRALLPKSASKS